jgi:DNA repair protein RadC
MSSDAGSTEPKRGGALGRLTAVMGSVRPTFQRRQRLRQCLIRAGAENLPDYELLQVMLFTSNPHTDVESLVGELLDRFGSLAEVMSADTEALAAAGLSLPAIAGVKFVREVALREVIRRALEVGASALILVHNHPSGDPAPSAADIAVTQDIIKAAASLGIVIHDHLIIGRGGHSSLRDLGLLRPEAESTGTNPGAPVFARPAALHDYDPKV